MINQRLTFNRFFCFESCQDLIHFSASIVNQLIMDILTISLSEATLFVLTFLLCLRMIMKSLVTSCADPVATQSPSILPSQLEKACVILL